MSLFNQVKELKSLATQISSDYPDTSYKVLVSKKSLDHFWYKATLKLD
jgi:hypothetical protein